MMSQQRLIVGLFWFLSCCFSSFIDNALDYAGHKLVRLGDFNEKQAEYLDGIEADVWGTDENLGLALVQLSPDQFAHVEQETSLFQNITIVENDLQTAISAESERIAAGSITSKAQKSLLDWFTEFHRFEEIKQWFENLERENKASMRLVRSIGSSHERRDIFALHIGDGVNSQKPKIWVQCLIHAREWVSGSVCQYIALELASGMKSNNPKIQQLLQRVQIIMVPVVNPDGYVFSWDRNRLWRKNRRGGGVDLNRNFDDHWGMAGKAISHNSDIFGGTRPASEPEVQAIQSYFNSMNYGEGVIAALDFHSFSQMILRPVGWSKNVCPHEDFLRYASQTMSMAMKGEGRNYPIKRSCELYLNSGTATDWFYTRGARYSIAIELPPSCSMNDVTGFMLPPNQILGICKEAFSGFMAFSTFALDNPLN